MTTRSPAVAGRFYPTDAGELARVVQGLLDTASTEGSADEPLGAAFVVPHAGYAFSGRTASYGYTLLRTKSSLIRRVVLIGPSHFVPLRGCAVPSTRTWVTPLGSVSVDVAGVAALIEAGHAVVDDEPHAREHSLEVQLPFLQVALDSAVGVLPIVVGPGEPDQVADTLTAAVAVDPAASVVLCSTDLSHYLDVAAATATDERTIQAVLDLAPERVGLRDACGVHALRGLLCWAGREGLTARLLHRSTSADATGDTSRVVGYCSVRFGDGPIR